MARGAETLTPIEAAAMLRRSGSAYSRDREEVGRRRAERGPEIAIGRLEGSGTTVPDRHGPRRDPGWTSTLRSRRPRRPRR